MFPTKGTNEEQLLFVLNYSVRAPSTHNTQPWLFKISANKLELFPDVSRKLPESDKYGRDICISLGACIEHTVIALKYFQMFDAIELHNEIRANSPVASINYHRSSGVDSLLTPTMQAIEERFNARGPFLPKEVPTDLLHQASVLCEEDVSAELTGERAAIAEFAALTAEGMRAAHSNKKFRKEIASWITHNYSSKKDGIPGYTMLMPGPVSLLLPFVIGTFNMGTVLAKLNTNSINSASGIGIIYSKQDEPLAWLRTGMLFERISLLMNSRGVRTSIFVASIEMPEIRPKLRKEFALQGLPQFTFAFGYPKVTLRQSPRLTPGERMV